MPNVTLLVVYLSCTGPSNGCVLISILWSSCAALQAPAPSGSSVVKRITAVPTAPGVNMVVHGLLPHVVVLKEPVPLSILHVALLALLKLPLRVSASPVQPFVAEVMLAVGCAAHVISTVWLHVTLSAGLHPDGSLLFVLVNVTV